MTITMADTARKSKPVTTGFKTSALASARRAGIAGVYAGPPDLAANRKRYARARAHGKTSTA